MWLAIIGINRAVLTEPLIIVEPDLDTPVNLRRALAAQLAVALALGAVVAAVGAVLLMTGVPGIGGPLLALAAVLPMLLTQDLWRALSFGVHHPKRTLANDLVFTAVQVILMAGLIAVGLTSSPWFVIAWGIGAAAGVVVGMVQFHARPATRPRTELLRELWPMSRWLIRDFATLFGAREAYLLIVAAFVTGAEFGGLRAAESLVGPAYVILLSGGNVALPGATRTFRDHGCAGLARYSRRVTIVVGGAEFAYSALLVIFGPWLMVTIYWRGVRALHLSGLVRRGPLRHRCDPVRRLDRHQGGRPGPRDVPGPAVGDHHLAAHRRGRVRGLRPRRGHGRQPRAGRASGHRHVPRVPAGCRQGRQGGAGLAPPDPGLRYTDERLGTPSSG